MKKTHFSFILIAFLSFLFPQMIVFGQSDSGNTNNFVFISLSPENPGPNENATASVSYSQGNIDSVNTTWYINGKQTLTGIGKRDITFKTGNAGESTTIRVDLETNTYGLLSKEITILPNTLEVLWEADTYTPPFYKGKALPSSQSSVKVVSLPHFVSGSTIIDPDNIVYVWKKGYFKNQNASGFGKTIYAYKTGYTFNDDEITVSAATQDGSVSITKIVPIHVYEPKIIFFENKPLQGIRYENSLSNTFNYIESEATIHAVPFFFSLSDLNKNNADFTWMVDGKKLETDPDNKTEFTLRKPDKGKGQYRLRLDINNIGYDLQTASKELTLSYDNQ
ncbi:hypothetical protein D4R99_01355 [bacterium]|nr:MAG: hypothetical protein D4R99_01355 [bacterium]